jgi:hypothetical protein
MTDFSGTLEGVGLPAIVRFLAGLQKTGCLRITHQDWRGEVYFDQGLVVGVTLGSRQGLSALDALVQALPGGSFVFDTDARLAGPPNVQLNREALQAYLDDLATRTASGGPTLPSLDAIPHLVPQDDDAVADETVPLDRGTLTTLLAIDGHRTVREIIAVRGSFEALWQVANLAQVGLVRLPAVEPSPTPAATTPPPPPRESKPVTPARTAPAREPTRTPAPTAQQTETVHCPKLGFEDDPNNTFGRPTRLHRCFAAGTPLPLSLDQQRELCLSEQYGTCPRLAMAGLAGPRPTTDRPSTPIPAPTPTSPPEKTPADDPRIVRWPVGGRTPVAPRGAATTDVQGAVSSEPTRFRPGPVSPREGSSDAPTPLRARGSRNAAGASATAAVVEPIAAPTPAAEPADAAPPNRPTATAAGLEATPPSRRLLPFNLPAGAVAGIAMVIVLVGVVGVLLAPNLTGIFSEEGSVDMSSLPNANAIAAGTPISDVAPARPTNAAAARPTAPAIAEIAAAVAATAPDPAATTAPTTAPAATVAAQPTTPPAAATVAPSGPRTLLDEKFDDNARDWPNNPQGTAWITGGSYRISPRQAGQFVAIGVPAVGQILQDVIVSATFRKVGGPAGGGYGIIVRDQGPAPRDGSNQQGRYYVLEAGDKGEVGIWRRENDRWIDLLPWQRADAVRPGGAPNELSVKAIGERLSLSVYGVEVGFRNDSTLAVGNVGIFVGGDGNQVAIDQLTIAAP